MIFIFRARTVMVMPAFAAALTFTAEASAQRAGTAAFRVTARSACYAAGPQQGRPPEMMVPKGAIVRFVPARPIGIYRRVETESGLQCWIDGSALRLMIK